MASSSGGKLKRPYAIAMKDASPFGIGGLWENWKDPNSGEWIRTFAVITTDANELVAEILNRVSSRMGFFMRLRSGLESRFSLQRTRIAVKPKTECQCDPKCVTMRPL